MGVPGLMSYILKNYKKHILLKALPIGCDWLHIDANCLFHPECFRVLDICKDVSDVDILEEKMFKRIIRYLDYIESITKPQKGMMIAVDGVAPRAKLGQQRKRRYRAIDDMTIRNNIKKKYGMLTNSRWNNTVITPGTVFMEKLHQKLLTHYKLKSTGIKYIYSSYHTAGEGEHKILQYMKSNTTNCINVIYGLDADLIFLALSAGIPNTFLLREVTHFGAKKTPYTSLDDICEEFVFVSIDNTKKSYNHHIGELIKCRGLQINTPSDYSVDFVLTCFLLGNDFIAHTPSVDIHKGGMDYIINAYVSGYMKFKKPLIMFEQSKVIICFEFLKYIFESLASQEHNYFSQILPEHKVRQANRSCPSSDLYEQEVWMLENMRTTSTPDKIQLGVGDVSEYKYRFYEHYTGASEYQSEVIESMCSQYIESIIWVARYYFESCPDWSWEYVYTTAPLISDISEYMKNMKQSINTIKFNDGKPISIQKQLMIVLPPTCSNLICTEYRKQLSNPHISDMFPKKVKLDMVGKDMWWMCNPLLPLIDIERINSVVDGIILSDEENIRNQNQDIYIL